MVSAFVIKLFTIAKSEILSEYVVLKTGEFLNPSAAIYKRPIKYSESIKRI